MLTDAKAKALEAAEQAAEDEDRAEERYHRTQVKSLLRELDAMRARHDALAEEQAAARRHASETQEALDALVWQQLSGAGGSMSDLLAGQHQGKTGDERVGAEVANPGGRRLKIVHWTGEELWQACGAKLFAVGVLAALGNKCRAARERREWEAACAKAKAAGKALPPDPRAPPPPPMLMKMRPVFALPSTRLCRRPSTETQASGVSVADDRCICVCFVF